MNSLMNYRRFYNFGILMVVCLLGAILVSKTSAGASRLVSVSNCSSCDGSISYPAQASEDTKVRRLISHQGMDPAAFTLAKGVAGDFWISGDKVCTLDQNAMRVRCHDHF